MKLTDQQIMEQVLAGQITLFENLVVRHRTSMLRAAVSMLRNPALAEEAVQECFLSAFARRQTFDPAYSFRGWLWTILLNTCRTYARRELNRADRAVGSDDSNLVLQSTTPETALSDLLNSERNQLLEQLLNDLPEAEADALRLRFFGGLKFEEIAQAMSSSLNGAKQRVRRGLERLSASARRNESLHCEGDER